MMTQSDLLNPEQKAAIEHFEGPLLVLAGAGSGKTRVVTHRIVNLIEMGIPASDILAVTFTNKAAGEMKERVLSLTHSKVMISTFHSLGAKILRESITALGYSSDFTIYDQEDVIKLVKSLLLPLGVKEKGEAKQIHSLISRHKNDFIAPSEVNHSELTTETEMRFPEVYAQYQAKLKEYNAVDFDDLLYLVVRLFRECPEVLEKYQRRWSFVLVDEYQDTNVVQYMMIRCLVERTGNLMVVGDPDQSIYSWRGANINNILNFERDYAGAKVIQLEQNYRSTEHILSAANSLIRRNGHRYEKHLWSDLGAGEKICLYHESGLLGLFKLMPIP